MWLQKFCSVEEKSEGCAMLAEPVKAPVSCRGGPLAIPGHFVRDLLWTEWQWDRIFCKYFRFSLSVSFHQQCVFSLHSSITEAL
jgi:hypothetical protein